MTSANNEPKWTPVFMEQFAREWLKHDILLPNSRFNGMSKCRITKMIASVRAKTLDEALEAAPPWVRDFDVHFCVINKVVEDNRLRAEQRMKANRLQPGSLRCQLLVSILRGLWKELKRLLAEGHEDIMDKAIEAVAKEHGYPTVLVNTIWNSTKKVAHQKLQLLQATGDRLPAGTAADLTEGDWLAADLLVAFDPGVTLINQDSLKDYDQLSTLTTLFSLAQIHHLDAWLSGTDPTVDYQANWQMATLDYSNRGFKTSMVVLQRRWYELVQLSRDRLSWFLTRNIAVPPICRQLALRFPSLVTIQLPSWAELVRTRRLVTPDYSLGEHTPSELAKSDVRPLENPWDPSKDDDIVLIENDIETIDLDGLDSDDEDNLIIDERLKKEKINLEQRKRLVMEDIQKLNTKLQDKDFFENRKQEVCTKLDKQLDSQLKYIETRQDKQIDSESNNVTSFNWSLCNKNNKEQTAPVSKDGTEIDLTESESLDELTNQTTVSLKTEIDITENDILQQSVKNEPETNTEKEDSTHKPIEETASTVNIENISTEQPRFSVFEQLDPSNMDTKIIFSDDEDECNIIEPLNPIYNDNRITSQQDDISNTPKEQIKEQTAMKTEHDLSNENEAINDRIVNIKEEIGIINLDTDDSDCEIITNVVKSEKECLQNNKDINQPISSTTTTKHNSPNKKRIGPKSFMQKSVEDESNKKKRIGPKSFMSSLKRRERLTFEDENYSNETNSDKPLDKDQSISSIARNVEDKGKTFKNEITSDDEDSYLVIAENNKQEIKNDVNDKSVSSNLETTSRNENSNLVISENKEQQEIKKETNLDVIIKSVSCNIEINSGDKNSNLFKAEINEQEEIKKEPDIDVNEKSVSSNLEINSDEEDSNLVISENNEQQENNKEPVIDVKQKNVSSNLETTSDDGDSNLIIAETNEQQEISKDSDIDTKKKRVSSQSEITPGDKNSNLIIEENSEQQEIKKEPNVDINEKNVSSKLLLSFNDCSDDENSNLVIEENIEQENKQESDIVNKKRVSSNFEITSDDEVSNLVISKNNEQEIKKETDIDVKKNSVSSNLEIAFDDEGSNLIISENKQEIEKETDLDVNKENVSSKSLLFFNVSSDDEDSNLVIVENNKQENKQETDIVNKKSVSSNFEITSDVDAPNLVIAENNERQEINKEPDIYINEKIVSYKLDITSDDGDPNLINEKNVASKPEFEKDDIDKENSDNIKSKVMLNAVNNLKPSVDNINNTQEGLTAEKNPRRERLSFKDEHTNNHQSDNEKKALVATETDEDSLVSNKEDLTYVNNEQNRSDMVHKEEVIETNFGEEERCESRMDCDSEVGDTSAMEEVSASLDIDKLLLPVQVPLHRIDDFSFRKRHAIDKTIDIAIGDSNLPHKRLKPGLRPTGWELSRKWSHIQRGLPKNPGLKNLDADFVIKNGYLLALLKPVTVELERLPIDIAIEDSNLPHKGLNIRLKPGLRPTGWELPRKRSYNQRGLPKNPGLKDLDADFVIKYGSLLAMLKPVTVELERLPLEVIEGYLEEQQASDQEDEEWHPRKIVRLTSIDEVRRINRGLLTAQVRPLVTYPGRKKQVASITDSDSESSSIDVEETDPPIQTLTSVNNTLTPEELDKVLKKLKVLRKDDPNYAAPRAPIRHRDYCCTARRHINYNRARARIAARAGRIASIVPIHARAGKSHAALQCECCCLNAMLGQETSSVRLAHDLRTLDNDLKRLADNKKKQGNSQLTSNQRRLSNEGPIAETTVLPTQPPEYSDEETSSASAKERRKEKEKKRQQDRRKRDKEREENKKNTKEHEEKQSKEESEYDEWMRQRNICAKYFTLNHTNNTTSKRPKYCIKARPGGLDSPFITKNPTPTLTKEMVERHQQMHEKPADELVAVNETVKEKVDAEETNTLKHYKNETKVGYEVSQKIVSDVVNNIREEHCYIKDPPVAIEPVNKPQSTPPPFATIEIRPITFNRPSIQLITSQQKIDNTANEEPDRPSGSRSRKSSLEELCEVATVDLIKHIDNQPQDPIDKPVDQKVEQTCPRYVIKSAPAVDGGPPTLILQPLPVDSSGEPSPTSKEIQLISLPDSVTSTQPLLSQNQVSVSEQTITLGEIENQLKHKSQSLRINSGTPIPIDKFDSIRQPQLKAMIESSRAQPGKEFMRILQTPKNDATVLATCTSNPDDPKQSTLRVINIVEQPTQNPVPIQLNQLVQPNHQSTQNPVLMKLNQLSQFTQDPVPNQLNQPIQPTCQTTQKPVPIQLNQSIQETIQVNESTTASQASPTSQTVKMIKTRIIIDVHSIDAGQGTPSEKNLQELLNKYCPQRTTVPPALININKQINEDEVIEIDDDDEEIDATVDKSMPIISQVFSSSTSTQLNLQEKRISTTVLSTSVDENVIIQNPSTSKQDNVIKPGPSTSRKDNMSVQSLPTSTQGNFFVLNPSISTQGTVLESAPSTSTQGNVFILNPSISTQGVFIPNPSIPTPGNISIPSPSTSNQANFFIPNPSIPTPGNISISSSSIPTQDNVFIPNPSIPTSGNISISSSSIPTQDNVFIPNPSIPTLGNISIPSPSTSTQANVFIPNPSIPAPGNISIPSSSIPTEANIFIPNPSIPSSLIPTQPNVFIPNPSIPTQPNVFIPSPSIPTQPNVFIPNPSIPTPGNISIPSPSTSTQPNVFIPTPSIPTQDNVSIPGSTTPLQANACNPAPSFIRVVQLPPVATPIIVTPQTPGTSGASVSQSVSAPQKSRQDMIQKSLFELKQKLQSIEAQHDQWPIKSKLILMAARLDQWPIENAVKRRPFVPTDLSPASPHHIEDVVQYIKASCVPPSDVQILTVNTAEPLLKLRNQYLIVTDKISPKRQRPTSCYPTFWTLNPSMHFSQIIFEKRSVPKFSVKDKNNSEASASSSESGSRLKVKDFAKLPGTENALNDDNLLTKRGAANPNKLLVDSKDVMYVHDKCFKKLEDEPLIYASVFKVVSDLSTVEWLAMQDAPLYLVNIKAVQTGDGKRLLPVQLRETLVDNQRVIDLACPDSHARGLHRTIKDLVCMLNSPFDQFGEPRSLQPGVTFTSVSCDVIADAPGDVIDLDEA